MKFPIEHKFQLLIDGKCIDGDSSTSVFNPATGARLATAPEASRQQLAQALLAAKAAFPAWRDRSHDDRQSAVKALADILNEHADELARLLTLEQGKPIVQAQQEVSLTASFFDHFASLALPNAVIEGVDGSDVEVAYEPLGVVGAIVPWNFPLLLSSFKLGPALVAGNCVVLKTAPTTPLTTLRIGELASETFPAGVLNIITGNSDLGAEITKSSSVNKIAFTGSTVTGKKVMAAAASNITRLTLELGGNDPAIVLEDADVATTASGIFDAAFLNAGQTCIAVKRVYVHASLLDPLLETFDVLLKNTVVGDGLHKETTVGPLQNKEQYEKVRQMMDASISDDARIYSTPIPVSDDGYFIEPTVVSGLAPDCQLVTEEQFGPLLPVLPFTSEDDVISTVNDSNFGLAASIWSADIERALSIAKRIQAGTVWINQHLNLSPLVQLGGAKQSGLGSELGLGVLKNYMQEKIIMTSVQ